MGMIATCDNCGRPDEAPESVVRPGVLWYQPSGWTVISRPFVGKHTLACSDGCMRALVFIHEQLDGAFLQSEPPQ